jgi:N6-adenosine-specific RNA methylase IME4
MLDFNQLFDPGLRHLPIEAIQVSKRHRRDLALPSLVNSIAELGLLQPIVVDAASAILIAGERRLEACRLLGWEDIPCHLVDIDQIVRGEYAENVERANFTPSEMVAIGQTIEEKERSAAKERMTLGKLCLGSDGGKTRNKVAAYAGISGTTYEKAKAVVMAAEAEPEKYGKLAADMDRTRRVDGAYKRLKTTRQAEAIRAEPPPLPHRGPYRVIVVDPPWLTEIRGEDLSNHRVPPYPPMSISEICAMDVASIAHPDCILWLWTTNSDFRHALQVLDAWGFEHKTILTWVKDRMGLGNWLRGQTEHCLMAARGKPTVQLTNQTTALIAPVRAHSQKPEEFYALVESLCPAPRYAYLFSREERDGWDMHGDEILQAAAA